MVLKRHHKMPQKMKQDKKNQTDDTESIPKEYDKALKGECRSFWAAGLPKN